MSEEDIKSKIISFRVSDHDYGAVEEASRKHGFTSVSLFARSATLSCNTSELVHSPLDVEINRLWRRIEVLTAALETLTARVSIVLDPVTWADLLVKSKLASPR
ncbi:MAG TPA: hypothetical protein VK604_17950 [Bryobacteraceae bacterium]|nr:hypothetical protein [Bryobacteraceae bacterium]HTF70434.1 hypothetical protein [Edaphobacter sp.]